MSKLASLISSATNTWNNHLKSLSGKKRHRSYPFQKR